MGYPAQFVGDGVNFVGNIPYTKDRSGDFATAQVVRHHLVKRRFLVEKL